MIKAGGWFVNHEMSDEAKAVWDKALEGFAGAAIFPVACATKVVSRAIEYKFVCVVENELKLVEILEDGKFGRFELIEL